MTSRNNLSDLDRELAQIDASLAASEQSGSQFDEDFEKSLKEDMSDRMDSHLNAVRMEFGLRLDEQMNEMDMRLREKQNQLETEMRESTIDLHAQSKALQVISRMLGQEWRDVYPLLFPLKKDQWQENMDMIAAQAPNKFSIQAFKMLKMYKEEKGDEYTIDGILEALNLAAKPEIVDEAVKVLYTGGEEIFHPLSASRNGIHKNKNKARSQEPGEMPYHNRPCVSELPKVNETDDPFEGPLANHRLLGFARKLGDKWQGLANELNVSGEDIQELSEYDDTKAAAFQMLYTWRDNASGTPKEKLYKLRDALERSDCSDLIDSLMPKEDSATVAEEAVSSQLEQQEDDRPAEEQDSEQSRD